MNVPKVNTGLSGTNYKNGQAGRFWNDYLPYLSNQLKTVVENSEMIYQSKFLDGTIFIESQNLKITSDIKK